MVIPTVGEHTQVVAAHLSTSLMCIIAKTKIKPLTIHKTQFDEVGKLGSARLMGQRAHAQNPFDTGKLIDPTV